MVTKTNTDSGGQYEWIAHDTPSGLRLWGTDITYPLPGPGVEEATIGAAADCWLQLNDPKLRISQYHARIFRYGGRWKIADLNSKNGISVDGARRPSILLTPGAELRIGGVVLVVESPLLCALRELLARLIGWSDERHAHVDVALRALRLAATRRDSLLLCGSGNLVSIARLLHNRTLGRGRPFVVGAPRRRQRAERPDPDADDAESYDNGMLALSKATGGTMCVWGHRPLADFDQVVAALEEPTSRVQLVVCYRTLPPSRQRHRSPTILLPPLAERASELPRIVDAFAADAVQEFGGTLTAQSRAWVLEHASADLARIATATARVVALNSAGGNVGEAALLLGLSKSSLLEWFAKRPPGYT